MLNYEKYENSVKHETLLVSDNEYLVASVEILMNNSCYNDIRTADIIDTLDNLFDYSTIECANTPYKTLINYDDKCYKSLKRTLKLKGDLR